MLEDSSVDAAIIQRLLQKEITDCSIRLVMSKEEFLSALTSFLPDVILADNSLPQFNASEALQIARQPFPAIPFILVTGTMPDEFAASIIKSGADDYILKDRLNRLPGAIEAALKHRQAENEKQKVYQQLIQSEKKFRNLLESAPDAMVIVTTQGIIQLINAQTEKLFGYAAGEVIGKHIELLMPFNDVTSLKESIEVPAKRKNGEEFPVEISLSPLETIDGLIITTAIRDITERKKAEQLIREINERYEFVNKATLDTIWEWDFIAHAGQWGEGFIKTFGYTREELPYGNWIQDYIHEDDKQRVKAGIDEHIKNKKQNWQDEYRFRCADDSYKYVYDRGYILFDENGAPYRMIGAMTDITEKRKLEMELAEQALRQQKLITEVTIQAQEKERNELGRELHDNINQILASVKMYLKIATTNSEKKDDLINRSAGNIDYAIEEIRKLSRTLVVPSLGDIGLISALQELTDDINLTHEFNVSLIHELYDEEALNKNLELMLYRIAQEQLNNIRKYAKAKEVTIALRSDTQQLFFIIEDDGHGFDPTTKAKGIGLKNISSRVDFYDGDIKIVSAPGKGCKLEIRIPLS